MSLAIAVSACSTVRQPAPDARSASYYEDIILANQQCLLRFDEIDRNETITVLDRDAAGNVVGRYPREEVVYDIVGMANDENSLGGVTSHPFFSAQDTFSVAGIRDGRVLVRVGSADARVRHSLANIVVEIEQATDRILGLTSDMLIHGYFRDGSHSVDVERLVAEWEPTNGCDLPASVRYHPLSDLSLQRPRLTTEIAYNVPSPGASPEAERLSEADSLAFMEAVAVLAASLDYSGPTHADILRAFAEHRAAFDDLEAMLREDRSCTAGADSLGGFAIEIGVDKVCDFWEHEGRWDRIAVEGDAVFGASQDEMLRMVGLSSERYERYLGLLSATGARRARIYTYGAPPEPAVPSYWVGGAGWVASSYYVNLVHLPARPDRVVDDVFAYIEREGYGTYKVYSELGDGWYAEMDMQW